MDPAITSTIGITFVIMTACILVGLLCLLFCGLLSCCRETFFYGKYKSLTPFAGLNRRLAEMKERMNSSMDPLYQYVGHNPSSAKLFMTSSKKDGKKSKATAATGFGDKASRIHGYLPNPIGTFITPRLPLHSDGRGECPA